MVALLRMYVIPELVEIYTQAIEKHNHSVKTDPYPNSGFDLFFPTDITFYGLQSNFIQFGVKCEMIDDVKSGYYIYPRSSISKTPLMLANGTGIIDSSYRGTIIGAFRNIDLNHPYVVKQYERLIQICHPSLQPFLVELVGSEDDLTTTTRGEGGFGSTGK